MSIHKKILKSYETLYKYNKSNKFSQKKNRSFIHLYFLLLQNKYRFNFDFKNYPRSYLLNEILNYLYDGIPIKKKRDLLFPDDKMLADIFFIKDDFDIEKYLTKLEEFTYNLNYVNTNIQIVDYLGNTENDVTVTKIGLGLLIFKEQFPLIKVNSKLVKNIVNHLVRTAKPINQNLTYINSLSVFILHNLQKNQKFTDYENYIKLVLQSQDSNGIWKSGYNTFLVENATELDIFHTAIILINLLDYQIDKRALQIKQEKENKNSKIQNLNLAPNLSIFPTESENQEHPNTSTNLEKENTEDETYNNLEEKEEEDEKILDELREEFTSFMEQKKQQKKKHKTQKTLEHFDNLSEVHNAKFYFDLNFYNTTLILVLVLVGIIVYRFHLKI